ncbi:MAG: rhombosortase [Proteobacteria bacterium]|nr:MAG: rhombosortase [Pseudomonadota bacterium]
MNIKLIIAALLISLLSFAMQWWQPDLLYVRGAVNQGEWWRILSGQLVHTNWPHFELNISSLLIFALLFYNSVNIRTFTISLFLLALGVGLSIHYLEPRIHWYAGLSGAIYGLYLVGAYSSYQRNDVFIAISVAALVIGKATFEHFYGQIHSNAELINARVVTEAHLYGIVGAIVLCGTDKLYRLINPKLKVEE